MKQVAILGASGSIGCNTLRVIESFKGELGVAALGAGSNIELSAEQIDRHRPRLVSVSDEDCALQLRSRLRERSILPLPTIGTGVDGLSEVATCSGVGIVIGAVV